jgi:hypothetical protein
VTHQSLGNENKAMSRGTISCCRRKKKKGRRRTSTQRDVKDKVLRSKELVDVAVAGWVIRDGFA